MNTPEQIDITQEVVQKVNAGQIKMRSRWEFVAKRIGLQSGIALSVAALVVSLSFGLYLVQQYRVSHLLSIGIFGWQRFLNYFPFEMIGLAALMIVGMNYLIRQTDWGYKRSWRFWAVVVIVVALPLALMLNRFQAAHALHQRILNAKALGFRSYFETRLQDLEKSFVEGTLIALDAETCSIQGDDTRAYTVPRKGLHMKPKGYAPQVGDRVIVIGEWQEQTFHAQALVSYDQIKQRWEQQ